MNEQFYFRQLLAGRDFAVGDDVATSMRNFSYALGDRETGDAILVDPAYRPSELVDMVTADEMNVVGVVATHFHPDHIGGTLTGDQHIAGIAELLALIEVPVHVQAEEAEWVKARTGVSDDALTLHHDRDQLDVGTVAVTLLHTPGHTPGSQCLLVEGRLLSGDTLEMYRTLSERLNAVSDETVLFPGHLYAPESFLSMGHVRARNYVFSAKSQEEWLAMFAS